MKLAKSLGLLAKIRHFTPSVVIRSLYYSFINSYIDYNLLNWGMATSTLLNSVNIKIKKAIRIISFKDTDHPSAPLFKNLELLPLNYSIDLKYAQHMGKFTNGFLPDTLASNFKHNSRGQLSKSLPRLESLKQYVLYAGPEVWDDLPNEITKKPTLRSFTNSLRTHFLNLL